MDTHIGFKERVVLVILGSAITGICVVIAAAIGILTL